MYVDLEDDSIKTIETELKHRVSEAVRNGLSKHKERKLKESIKMSQCSKYLWEVSERPKLFQ